MIGDVFLTNFEAFNEMYENYLIYVDEIANVLKLHKNTILKMDASLAKLHYNVIKVTFASLSFRQFFEVNLGMQTDFAPLQTEINVDFIITTLQNITKYMSHVCADDELKQVFCDQVESYRRSVRAPQQRVKSPVQNTF